ncbi:unnamed protein product [Acanthoscelides obtectus]|uniref:Uncharacterized protein n=1 Tax=Acanthoscelides obtectus TaxID=200917 RepID=A0A9P0LQE3_ACAOB|nr:unnamed protein product [Acanthoscelides obtectus]CAK1660799.1 hypothetical protein AOBTE_LOCUS22268 [Acanthoscelides obtectus]
MRLSCFSIFSVLIKNSIAIIENIVFISTFRNNHLRSDTKFYMVIMLLNFSCPCSTVLVPVQCSAQHLKI